MSQLALEQQWFYRVCVCVCACVYKPGIRGHADHTLPLGRNIGPRTRHLYNFAGVQQTVAVRVADCGRETAARGV